MKIFKKPLSIALAVILIYSSFLCVQAVDIFSQEKASASEKYISVSGDEEELTTIETQATVPFPSPEDEENETLPTEEEPLDIGEVHIDNDIVLEVYSDYTATLIRYEKQPDENGKLFVPSKIGGYTVTSIADYAYIATGDKVKEIVFGEDLTGFCGSLLKGKNNVEKITFLGNVASFYWIDLNNEYTNSLKYIDIPNSTNFFSVDGVVYSNNDKAVVVYPRGKEDTTFTIPDYVTEINYKCFYMADNLKELILNENLRVINSQGISLCHNLEKIDFSKCKRLSFLGYRSVLSNKLLDNIVLPSSLQSLGSYAFANCSNLKNIQLNQGLDSLCLDAFSGCTSLTSLNIPKTVREIQIHPNGLSLPSLKQITVENGNTAYSIEDGALVGIHNSQKTLIYYPENSDSKSHTIGDDVEVIFEKAFSNNNNLEEIYFGSGVKTIEENAFNHCKSLKKVYVNDDLKTINTNVFKDCPNDLCLHGKGQSVASLYALENRLYFCDEATKTVYTPKALYTNITCSIKDSGNLAIEKYNTYSKETEVIIPEELYGFKVTYISDNAFSGAKNIRNITIPETVKHINSRTFENCTALEKVFLGRFTESIGDYAFSGCKNLVNIETGTNIDTIGNYAFNNCQKLIYFNGGKNITSIGNYAFYQCYALEKMSFGSNLKTIGMYAFYKCSELSSSNTSDLITDIGSYAFYDCDKIETFSIGNKVKYIQKYTFYSCDNLRKIENYQGVESFEDSCFASCVSLESVTIPEKATGLYTSAFDNCISLTEIKTDDKNSNYSSIDGVLCNKAKSKLLIYPMNKKDTTYTIPDSILTIDSQAFKWAQNLKTVVIHQNITAIPYRAFSYSSIVKINIPKTVTALDKSAFDHCKKLKTVTLMAKISTIPQDTFLECASLESISIGMNITEVDKNAFKNCSSLNNFDFGLIKTIGSSAFEGTGFDSITFPAPLEKIMSKAFYNCKDLTKIAFHSGLKSIGDYAFGFYDTNTAKKVRNTDLVIYCFSGSAPYSYAQKNGLKYEIITNDYFANAPGTDWDINTDPQPAISSYKMNLASGKEKVINVTEGEATKWTTSNKRVAIVKNGLVTALSKGTANITVKFSNGATRVCKVNVTSSPLLSKDYVKVKKGKTVTIKLSGKSDKINNVFTNTKYGKFVSKPNSTALKIKGLKKGTTTLRVKVNGVKTLKIKVKVIA